MNADKPNIRWELLLCVIIKIAVYLHACVPWYSQRSHGLFGNRVDSFSAEPTNAQSSQMTNQRPLQFSEGQPESPPNSTALVSSADFFPTTAPKSNTNNNAFAEWVTHTLLNTFNIIYSGGMMSGLFSDFHLKEKIVQKNFTIPVRTEYQVWQTDKVRATWATQMLAVKILQMRL